MGLVMWFKRTTDYSDWLGDGAFSRNTEAEKKYFPVHFINLLLKKL